MQMVLLHLLMVMEVLLLEQLLLEQLLLSLVACNCTEPGGGVVQLVQRQHRSRRRWALWVAAGARQQHPRLAAVPPLLSRA